MLPNDHYESDELEHEFISADTSSRKTAFLEESRYKTAGGKFTSQEQRVRVRGSRLCDKNRLCIRTPTHIAQHVAENVKYIRLLSNMLICI